ncbi:hypothetical protein [Virgibacillus salinus]|uniref:Shikimate / quinate 5-dehydrogenase n=1 Tax=Virgibacillus salinus TaxID=553311 RepID=A0A1H0YIJ2_9BACI|nr:hypothetical protein [Virgibacillus salinus]SDQ15065.1 Shikimate / quinate 5-dehydrogenase [Virgibacillus salinus]
MEIKNILQKELSNLQNYTHKSIMISTTAKHALAFRVLPRRTISRMSMACFMINDKNSLEETLSFFDGEVDYIYIDIEQKQDLNLFKTARETIKKSKIETVKPNDITVESCDLLIRYFLNDDLYDKKVIVIGTGNLASKIATRLAERQAHVYIKGRNNEKEITVTEALNIFLPKHTPIIKTMNQIQETEKVDVVISFLSGQLTNEETIFPVIGENSFIIDGGINNFSNDFIQHMLSVNINITRLDTRIALPYQFLSTHDHIHTFFKEVYGQAFIKGVPVVAGGYIGADGTVIVDNIKHPNQVIGIADGLGGVKVSEQLSEADRSRIYEIKKVISTSN